MKLFQYTIIAIFSILVQICKAGNILGAEPILDFSNSNYMTQMHIKFNIETQLQNTDYMKLVFPFALHTKLTASSNSEQGLSYPKQLYLTWNELNQIDGTNYYEQDQPGQIFTETVDSANYYLQFYNLNYTQYSLESEKFYIIKFNISDINALPLQKSGELLQIQAFTQSSVNENALVYDYNPCFSYIYLENSPTQLIDLATTFANQETSKNLNTEQELFLDLTINYPISGFEDEMRIVFLLSDNSFTFTDQCGSIAKTTIPTIQALQESEITCNTDAIQNQVIFIIKKSAFERQNKMRFQIFVKSPKKVLSGVDIISRLMYKQNPKILTETTDEDVLQTNPIDVRSQNIFLSFGLQPANDLPFPLKFVRGDEADQYHPYNGVKLEFQLQQDSPVEQELRVNIFIKSEINAHVLINSISENLPSYQGKQVTCQEIDNKFPLKRRISCSGVGQLLATETYHVAFRIFLPYDVYETDIDCSTFGVLTIETSEIIQKTDNLFILGRDQKLAQHYSKQLDSTPVYQDIPDYLEYLKSFNDVYLMAISSDFPDYNSQMYPSFYKSSENKRDIFLPQQNLNFLNYVKQFPDLWIIQKNVRNPLQQYDIIKTQTTKLLVKKSIPKNTLTIPSVVGKNWYATTGNPLISSVADGTTIPGSIDQGLKKDAGNQMLTFDTAIPFTDMTGFDNTASTDYTTLNNVGILFIMNPKIQLSTTGLTTDWLIGTGSSGAVSNVQGTYQAVDNDINSYTYFKLSVQNSDVFLDDIADDAGSDMVWGIRDFVINDYSSIYVDDRLMDFYICAIDGIDGPKNLQSTTSYNLINGFSLSSTQFTNFAPYISNFWETDNTNSGQGYFLSGQYTTSFYKLIGEATTGLTQGEDEKIALFFDVGQGLFDNKHNYKTSCAFTEKDNESTCRILPKGTKNNLLNYDTLNRFEADITDPTAVFQIMIPISLQSSSTDVNLYIATLKSNPNYQDKPYYYINGVQKIATSTFTIGSTAMALPFYVAGNSGGHFGITPCTGDTCTVGSMTTAQELVMGLDTTSATANKNSQLTFISDYEFLTENSVLSGWDLAGSGDPTPCLPLIYKYIDSDIVQMKYGIACTWFSGSLTGTSTNVQISEFKLPEFSGLNIQAYGSISNETGDLVALVQNEYLIENSATIETVKEMTITPSMRKQTLKWEFVTPVDITRDFIIKIETVTNTFTFSQTNNIAECDLLLLNDGENQDGELYSINYSCTPTFTTQSILIYTFTNIQNMIPASDLITILHYGIESSSTGADDTFNISILYRDTADPSDIIATTTTPVNILYDSTSPVSALTLSDFTSSTLSKNAITTLSFKFSLTNKRLWPEEQFIFDLGQFAFENQFIVDDLECQVLDVENNKPSHDFEQITLGKLSDLTVVVRKYIDNLNPSYILQCQRFQIPTASFSQGISSQIQATDKSTTLISQVLSLPTFSQNKPNIYENSIQKNLGTPGSNLDLIFTIQTSKLDVDSKSRVIIIFPIYYPPQLSRDNSLSCYYNNIRIACIVTQSRTLELKYFPTTIPKKQKIVVQVTGVTQPLNYQIGEFFIAFDDDYDNTNFIEYSTILDQGLESQGVSKAGIKGTLDIKNFQVSSNYLRADNVQYKFTLNYPQKYQNIKYGYAIMVNYPSIFSSVFQNFKPFCSVNRKDSDKEYAGVCEVKGLRIFVYIKEEMISGFDYIIYVSGIRNPDEYVPNIMKFSLEIADNNLSKVIYRSIESSTNFIVEPYLQDPDQDYMFYKDKNGEPITQLNLIKGVQSPTIYIGRESQSPTFARSFSLKSKIQSILTNPISVDINVGTTIQDYNIQSTTAIGEYAFQLEKEGDGKYYSNLPILFLRYDNRNLETFQITQTAINIYSVQEQKQFLIFYDINCLPPIQGLTINFFIKPEQTQIGLQIWEQYNLKTIFYDQPFGYIPLQVSDVSSFIVGSTIDVHYSLFGDNVSSYILDEDNDANKITFTVVAAPSVEVEPTIVLGLGTQNTQIIDIQCNHNGIFYWQLYLQQYGSQCIQSNEALFNGGWRNYTQNDLHFQCDSKYGIEGIYQENTSQSINLINLKADTKYSFVGQCVSQTGQVSEKITQDFTTGDNGGQLGKIRFDFAEKPTLEQETKLACFLSLFFKTHPKLVQTLEGTYCTQINYQINPDEINRRRNLVLSQDLGCTGQVNQVTDLNEEGITHYPIYFYLAPNHFLDTDDLQQRIVTSTQNACFKDYVQEHANGIPEIIQVHNAYLVPDALPELENNPKVYSGFGWVNVDNFKLNIPARVFMTLEPKSNNPPTAAQVQNGFTSDNQEPMGYTDKVLQTNEQEFNITYTNLQEGIAYTLYYVIGQESPYNNVKTGDLQSLDFTTDAYPENNQIRLNFQLSILILLFITMFY